MFNKEPSNARDVSYIQESLMYEKKQTLQQVQTMEEQTDILYDLEAVNRQSVELLAKSVAQTKQISRYTEIIAELSKLNTEHIAQITKMTQENQKSSIIQFCASIIISIVALIIAFLQLSK